MRRDDGSVPGPGRVRQGSNSIMLTSATIGGPGGGTMTDESLFAAALEKASDAERQAFLAAAVAGDDALRRRVEWLLAGDAHAGGPLDSDVAQGPPPEPVAEGPGTVVGRYRLKEQIGEGGFGLVFVAEQTEPVRRKVALKLIKPGMDTRE